MRTRTQIAVSVITVFLVAMVPNLLVRGQPTPPVGVPVGAIVGFALKPGDVKHLAPQWLPADGRTVKDPASPLNKRVLPDLTGRMMLGVAPTVDSSSDAGVVGGSRDALHLETDYMADLSCQSGDYYDDARLTFPDGIMAVWDVKNAKEMGCQHKHKFVVESSTEKGKLPLPPYRGVIYMVKVR